MSVKSYYYLARFVLQTETPLSIGTGSVDGIFDNALVRDANDLPAIPGSSLAGVLRHAYQAGHGKTDTDNFFGFQERTDNQTEYAKSGASSRLQVSWGSLLNSQGKLVTGLKQRSELEQDMLYKSVLDQLDAPIVRNRVRIGARGAAAGQGKYDRVILPRGHRFAVELSLWSDKAEDEAWNNLITLLQEKTIRLGGMTHAGLGRMQIKRLRQGCFNLQGRDTDNDIAAFQGLSRCMVDYQHLKEPERLDNESDGNWLDIELKLQACDYWRIGEGRTSLQSDPSEKTPKSLPVTEEFIAWKDGDDGSMSASLQAAVPLVPASSVKGALAHRTAFYANCFEQRWVEDVEVEDWDKSDSENGSPIIHALFGFSKKNVEPGKPSGQAGSVYIDEAMLDTNTKLKVGQLTHNVIDRFTGGVRKHLLFTEELLWQTPITLKLQINKMMLSKKALEALHLALQDLCEGRLALGAGSGKGHGTFKATKPQNLDKLVE